MNLPDRCVVILDVLENLLRDDQIEVVVVEGNSTVLHHAQVLARNLSRNNVATNNIVAQVSKPVNGAPLTTAEVQDAMGTIQTESEITKDSHLRANDKLSG